MRNIFAFAGADLTCIPDFYLETTRLLKARTGLWVLLETNGYGLIKPHLQALREAGLDTIRLDLKA